MLFKNSVEHDVAASSIRFLIVARAVSCCERGPAVQIAIPVPHHSIAVCPLRPELGTQASVASEFGPSDSTFQRIGAAGIGRASVTCAILSWGCCPAYVSPSTARAASPRTGCIRLCFCGVAEPRPAAAAGSVSFDPGATLRQARRAAEGLDRASGTVGLVDGPGLPAVPYKHHGHQPSAASCFAVT